MKRKFSGFCVATSLLLLLLQGCGDAPFDGSWSAQMDGDLTGTTEVGFIVNNEGNFIFSLTLCSDSCKTDQGAAQISGNMSSTSAILEAFISGDTGLSGAVVGSCSAFMCSGLYETTLGKQVFKGSLFMCCPKRLGIDTCF
jgi:hypothetical protein